MSVRTHVRRIHERERDPSSIAVQSSLPSSHAARRALRGLENTTPSLFSPSKLKVRRTSTRWDCVSPSHQSSTHTKTQRVCVCAGPRRRQCCGDASGCCGEWLAARCDCEKLVSSHTKSLGIPMLWRDVRRMRPGGEGACVTTLLEMPFGAQR